jgi:hypothetical protein
MMLPIIGLVIQEDGFIEFEVTTAGETIRVDRIKVQFAPPAAPALERQSEVETVTPFDPNASLQPSEQSLAATPVSEHPPLPGRRGGRRSAQTPARE